MRIDLYLPEDCPFVQRLHPFWGIFSGGSFQWLPEGYEGAWSKSEQQEWVAWCRANPDALIPTSHEAWLVRELLPYIDALEPILTETEELELMYRPVVHYGLFELDLQFGLEDDGENDEH